MVFMAVLIAVGVVISPILRVEGMCPMAHLINITADAKGSHGAKATYRWHGEWRSLDQILCSPSLAARKQSSVIGDLPFLLEDDEKYGGKKPYRTYLGPRYLGGYSDHLPLVVQFSSH